MPQETNPRNLRAVFQVIAEQVCNPPKFPTPGQIDFVRVFFLHSIYGGMRIVAPNTLRFVRGYTRTCPRILSEACNKASPNLRRKPVWKRKTN